MALKTPSVSSTRLSLPLGVAGNEPADAAVGTLAYATDTEKVRVKKASGWADVGSGGGGTVTEVDGTNGITATNPTGPIVTLEPDYGSAPNTVCEGDDPRLSNSRPPSGAAGGDLSGTYPNPNVAAVHETSGPTQLTIGSIASGQLLVRSGATIVGQTGAAPTGSAGGDLSGTYPNPNVAAIHETSGPTKLTVGAISSGQVLVRSGTTLVGQTGAAPTGSAGGDLSGSYPNPNVAAIHETSGPTQLTFGAIAAGQVLTRSGSTIIGSTPALYTDRPGNPYTSIPASPDAWSLEARNMTNPDLAANGWSITLLDSPWTTQTRAGNLGTSLTANHYNSEVVDGLLGIQLIPNVATLIYKAIAGTAFSYKARVWHTDVSTSSGCNFGLATGTQRKAGSTKSYVVGIDGTTGSGASQMVELSLTAPSTFNIFTNTAAPDNAWDAIRYVDFTNSGGGNEQVRMVDEITGRLMLNPGNRLFTFAPTIAVIWIYTGNGAPIWLDFVRQAPYLSLP